LHQGTITGGRIESRDACPSGAQTLGERALRGEFHLKKGEREGEREGGRGNCGCGCVEGRDACPSGAQTLGEGALRGEFHLSERGKE